MHRSGQGSTYLSICSHSAFMLHFIKEYLSFSKKERTGVLLLIILMLILAVYPDIRYYFSRSPLEVLHDDTADWERWQKHFSTRSAPADDSLQQQAGVTPAGAPLHPFNPNTLDAQGWQELGVPAKTVKTILKYRERGGRFQAPADLHKIYGLPAHDARRLIPYVRLERPENTAPPELTVLPARVVHRQKPDASHPEKPLMIDINRSDSVQWIALPGIGPAYARRILRYREKLGGFYDILQVAETYGLPDSTFRRIQPMLICTPIALHPLMLNEAGEEELSRHPYINRKQAREIIAYRKQHGRFESLHSLSPLASLTGAELDKITPYLKF